MAEHLVFSPRGYPLVLEEVPSGDRLPTLTVELAPKWYSLFVVTAGDVVTEVPHGWSCLDNYSPPAYVDHTPNPRAVELYAEDNGYYLDDLALDLIVGRWTREREL